MVQSSRKLIPYLWDDDLQRLPNKKSVSPKFVTWSYAKKFWKVNEDNAEKWVQSGVCQLGFQHMTRMDITNTTAKQKGKRGEEDESEGEESSDCVIHTLAVLSADTH